LMSKNSISVSTHLIEVSLNVVAEDEGEDDSDELEEEDEEAGQPQPEEELLLLLGQQQDAHQRESCTPAHHFSIKPVFLYWLLRWLLPAFYLPLKNTAWFCNKDKPRWLRPQGAAPPPSYKRSDV
jgi:hypothetical protein